MIIYPLTASQQHVASTCKFLRSSSTYVIAETFITTQKLHTDQVLSALLSLLLRKDYLRAAYTADLKHLICLPHDQAQSIIQSAEHVFSEVSTTDLPEDVWLRRVDDIRASQESKPFDLTRPPLLRVTAIDSPIRHAVVIAAHHAFFDGLSFIAIAREILQSPASRASGTKSASDIELLLSKHSEQLGDRARNRFWTEALHDLSPASALAQIETAGVNEISTGQLSGAQAKMINERAAEFGLPVMAIFLHSLVAAARDCMDLASMGMSVVHHNRDTLKEAKALGEFAQWVPIPCRALKSRDSVRSDLEHPDLFWREVTEALALRLPYRSLVAERDASLVASRYGLTRALFNFIPLASRKRAAAEDAVQWRGSFSVSPIWAIPDLYFQIVEQQDGYQIVLRVNKTFRDDFPASRLIAEVAAIAAAQVASGVETRQ